MRLRSFVRSVLLAGAVSVLVAEDARAVLSFPESAQVTADWDTFGGNVDEYIPRLAIGPDDRATVAWRQEVSANAAIYVRRVAVDGTMEAQRRATPNGEVGADAQVVTGSDGVSTVVWVNGDGVNDDAIMARRLLPDDSWEGPGFELSDSANAAGDPNIAIDSQGRVVVAWERDNDIEAARISAAGTPGSVIELAADADQYYRPEVTMDHADRALVTYDRFDGAFMSSILARRINANGSLEPQRSIYIADSDSQATNPDVAFTSGDVAVIAFATEDTNTFEKTVQSRTLNEIGGLGAIQTLGAPGGSATDPTTLMDSQDRARVVWSAGPPSLSTEEVTQVRRLDVNAQPTGAAPLEIANGAHAQAVIDSRDRISVAYELEPDHESVQVRRISADGVPGPAKTVAGLDPYYYLRMAIDSAGRPVLAMGGNSPDIEHFIARGVLSAPETSITSGPTDGATVEAGSVQFTFASTAEVGESFRCSLDGAAFAACSSPLLPPPLAPGSHSFAVRALDEDAVDLTPASRTFTVATPDTGVDGFFAKAKRKQKQKGKKIRLEVKLGAGEDVRAVAKAEVKLEGSKKKRPMTSGSKDIASQEGALKLKPKKKSDERKIVKALKRDDKVKAKITVTVTDAAGNEASKKLDVKLVRG